jgi:hypothetical protein
MGEVYRARDTRLGRDVALKILPAEVAKDPARRQRFDLEARAVAALNHPNIVAIYDVGDGYIVTELVDGEPLHPGGLSLRKAIDISVQIASGLACAHDAGITHRDLKPDNILLTRDGRVKILDFGLAKMAATRAAAAATGTVTVYTEPGVVMGTAGYMSPEQVRGQATDHRSDIFNLGLILYEMLAGRRAFTGDTSVEVMTAILKQDAPELPDTVPASVRQIVAHCLEKEPRSRFQSARDLGFALSQTNTQSGGRPAIAKRRNLRWPAIAAACAVLGAAAGFFLRSAPSQVQWSAVMLGGPEIALGPRISPDGHLLAFQAMVDGQTQLALMKPETGNWSVLTKDRTRGGVINTSWAADGSQIYYDRYNDVPQGVFTIPVLGGEERLVLENAMSPERLPDGSLLVIRLNAQRRQLFRFWPDSGRLKDYAVQVPLNHYVRALAGGREVVAFGAPLGSDNETAHFLVVDLASGAVRPLRVEALSALVGAWAPAPDGQSIISTSSSGSLTRVLKTPVNAGGGSQTLFTTTESMDHLELAPDGGIYTDTGGRPAELVRLSLAGADLGRVASLPRVIDTDIIALLPDGRAVFTAYASGGARLMTVTTGSNPVALINTTEETSAPMTPLGPREIAFAVGPKPRQTIAIAEIGTGRITRRLTPGKGVLSSMAASSDGKTLYFGAGFKIWSMPSAGGDVTAIRPGNSVVVEPTGRALVVSMSESTGPRLFSVPLDGGPQREITIDRELPLDATIALTPGSIDRSGRLLVPLSPLDSWFNPIGVLTLATGQIVRVPSNNRNDHHTMVWMPDGQILAQRLGLQSAIWKFTPEAKTGNREWKRP